MRLIDADSINWYRGEDEYGNPVYILDKRDVDKEPTAYDPEKVIEQIKDAGEKTATARSPHVYYKSVSVRKATEIIKGGGVDGSK